MRCRRTAVWLLSVPLMVDGSQAAHALAYRLAYPDAHVRLRELLLDGHAYMIDHSAFLPMLLGVAAGLELVAFGWTVAGLRTRRASPVPWWAFGLLPPLGFALQESLERVFAGSADVWRLVLEPSFRIGLLLQLPFALAAMLLARILLRVAVRVAEAVARTPERVRPLVPSSSRCPGRVWARRPAALAEGHAGRGPPLLVR